MQERKSFVPEAIGFGFRALIEHVRLFVIVLLAGTGVIALVVGIIGYLNKIFIQTVMSSQALQNYQECVGYNCAAVAYQSGASLMSLVSNSIFSLSLSAVALAIFFVGFDLGFKKIALNLYDKGESSLGAMFSCFGLAPKAFIGWILYGIMVWLGWLFFVLPGFIALLRFAFFPYFIIDKHTGPIAALKMSYEVTKHHVWDIFAFWVAIKIIGYLGFLSWVGILLSWPLSTLAYAFFYRKLVVDSMDHRSSIRSAV
ncbi:MAG TPA: hypothetical protein VLB80_03670 [Candidatus Babeliales bacterium]|nr:hypothetical protein [Candidatus Babeliales bacterium]